MTSLTETLSGKEMKIYNCLKAGAPVPLDRIVEEIGSTQPDEKSRRKAAINGIKTMGGKLAAFNYRIRMVEGGRGKGKKGVFLLEKINQARKPA